MKFLETVVVIALLFTGWSARSVHADHLNFTLYNQGSRAIVGIYISDTFADAWGENILDQSDLKSGDNILITFPGQNPNSPCLWNIKVIYEDGTSPEVRDYDLCQSNNTVFATNNVNKQKTYPPSGGGDSDCASKYKFYEDRMCHCYNMC